MRLLWSLLTLAALLTPTWAAEVTYIGPINTFTSWNNAITWSGGQVPGANDDVIIPASAKLSFSTNDPITISSLTMASGSTLYFNTSDPFGPQSPIITVKSFALGNAANTEAVTIDGVALVVTSTFSATSTGTTARTLSFINYASLSISSTATTTLSSSIISFSTDSPGIFDSPITVNGDVTVNGAVKFKGVVSVTQGATLTVVGSYGIFSGAVSLASQSTLFLRSLCTFESSATISGDATSHINIDGITSYLDEITITIPITILSGITTFTAQAILSNVDVSDDAILAINNNATITTLVLHNNSTIGTFAITQSRAGVIVDTLTITDNHINIRGVNLVTRIVSMTSSQSIDVLMISHATWTWLTSITSNTDVTISTSDDTISRIIHVGAATIPTLNIHVCYTNTSTATYNGASTATLTLQTPSSMICTTNTTDIIDVIPTSSPTSTSTPTSTPTSSPTGQPIQGTNSSTGSIGVVPTNDAYHVYTSIWMKWIGIIVMIGMIV